MSPKAAGVWRWATVILISAELGYAMGGCLPPPYDRSESAWLVGQSVLLHALTYDTLPRGAAFTAWDDSCYRAFKAAR